ncbi:MULTISPECIES: hypothetical protein [unclassified Janthinobacterium]|nr:MULTISPECIES: hypothetical protein [unclassified Janthinobacterium]
MADNVKKLIRDGMAGHIEVIPDGILFAVSMFLEKKTSRQKKD